MKSEILLKELSLNENVQFFKDVDDEFVEKFKNRYSMYSDSFFLINL